MARALRIKYKNALYHITSRGNERRNIFESEQDRDFFIRTLEESLNTYQVILYSYVLMSNHFHFLLETPLANISEFMRRFNTTYTYYYNQKYKRVGHLFQGRYKSILVQKDNYLHILSRYIHLNPLRMLQMEKIPLKEKEKYLREFKWSSLKGYINKDHILSFIDYQTILSEYGGDNPKGRKNYWQALQGDLSSKSTIKKQIIGNSILGNEQFIREIKEKYLVKKEKEIPSVKKIHSYCTKDKVIKIACREIGRTWEQIKITPDSYRQILMKMLYLYVGLNNREIGELMALDYSTVSVGRRRLGERCLRDTELQNLVKRIEEDCQR